jgi:hypothetical protein
VVQAQLEALRQGDAPGVFRFASPSNRAATGPPGRFAAMLAAPPYRPLLAHEAADLLRSVQMKPDVAVLIVGERGSWAQATGGGGGAGGTVPQPFMVWHVPNGPLAGPEAPTAGSKAAAQADSRLGLK